MTSQTQMDPRAKDAFWAVVEDCLIEIHKLSQPDAHQRTVDLRHQIEHAPPGICHEIIYHDEPFDVACDLAGKKLDLSSYRSNYELILGRHNW